MYMKERIEMLYMNIRSINRNIHEFLVITESLKSDIDCIVLSEN